MLEEMSHQMEWSIYQRTSQMCKELREEFSAIIQQVLNDVRNEFRRGIFLFIS